MEADDTLRAVLRDCLAAPNACPLARGNATVDSLYNEITDLKESVKYNPILLGSNLTIGLIEYTSLYSQIYTGIKSGIPSVPTFAYYIDAILQRNLTQYELVLEAMSAPSKTVYPNLSGPENIYGIQCPDTALRTENLSDLEPLIETWEEDKTGGEILLSLQGGCARWKMHSKETYSGPFNATTKNPILLISSPYDPATPMVSAQNMSTGFTGSVVLQHNHIGVSHTT